MTVQGYTAKIQGIRRYLKIMEYKGYYATIEYDKTDDIFVGKVLGLSDSLNFHGKSISEAENMFHQSIDNYLDFRKKTDEWNEGGVCRPLIISYALLNFDYSLTTVYMFIYDILWCSMTLYKHKKTA